jgi:hypothetical protein
MIPRIFSSKFACIDSNHGLDKLYYLISMGCNYGLGAYIVHEDRTRLLATATFAAGYFSYYSCCYQPCIEIFLGS